MPDDRPVSPEEHDERESAYANGYEHGRRDEREAAIEAGVFRFGAYVTSAALSTPAGPSPEDESQRPKEAIMEAGNQVIPVSEVQALATTIAVTVAQALIQAKGDPTGAIARLESVRGIEVGVADNGSGFRMDIIQAAQESINAAAEMEASDGA